MALAGPCPTCAYSAAQHQGRAFGMALTCFRYPTPAPCIERPTCGEWMPAESEVAEGVAEELEAVDQAEEAVPPPKPRKRARKKAARKQQAQKPRKQRKASGPEPADYQVPPDDGATATKREEGAPSLRDGFEETTEEKLARLEAEAAENEDLRKRLEKAGKGGGANEGIVPPKGSDGGATGAVRSEVG